MAFGKADTGLIKATAGAEAGKFMDDKLMIGSVIGTALNTWNEQAKAQQGINKQLQKELDEQFKAPGGTVHPDVMAELIRITPEYKKNYSSAKGSGVDAKNAKNVALQQHASVIDQADYFTAWLQSQTDAGGVEGPGANDDTRYYNTLLRQPNLKVETNYDANGGPILNYALPKKQAPDPSTFTVGDNNITMKTIENKILEAKAEGQEYELNEEEINVQNAYKSTLETYNTWNSLPDKVDGYYNPEKYQIVNKNNMNRFSYGENYENKNIGLDIYNKNITLKKDNQLYAIPNAADLAGQWNTAVRSMDEGKISGKQLQDVIWGDLAEDGIENSFGKYFVNGIDSDKHPEMYMKNGKPLVFNLPDGKTIEYGSDEWNAELVDGEHSEGQKQILDRYLRGYTPDGNIDINANEKWLIDSYSSFMGQVTKDAFEIKRRNHYETKGTYFDNGTFDKDNKYTSNTTNVFSSPTVANNNKSLAYNEHLFDSAFPKELLRSDMEQADLEALLDDGGKVQKAFEMAFENVKDPDGGDMKLVFDDGVVTIGGEEFDFTEGDRMETLDRMKKYISNPSNFAAGVLELDSLTNSIDGDDWQEIRDERNTYYSSRDLTGVDATSGAR